ncbi:MAG: hypothetical protein D6B28_03905 [Gammaproteobacteria bacterium]|nr:MAG: hypothetical protein D6B28_03905 [Gammaproteobacteria bacterium]
MKQNDPNNLRAPAMRMLVNLLPPGSEAGVWTFAKWTNEFVRHGKVTKDWQTAATNKASQIRSPGQFTDIALVLEDSSRDWDQPVPYERRSVILLTDGVVDVSKDPLRNIESRKKLLEEIVPYYKRSGIKIHTIALSENADIELLENLAVQTDGAHIMVKSADQLQKAFLKLFEKSVKRETLPLKGNKFSVDSSVNELTILVFNSPDSPRTELKDPEGNQFKKNKKPPKIKWHHDSGYDLITISKPKVGEWEIIADIDPDNRVMIVSDLKLKSSQVPNNLINGESFLYETWLEEEGEIIDKPDFHKFVKFSIEQTPPEGKTKSFTMKDHGLAGDKAPRDGIYTYKFAKSLRTTGEHEIITQVNGETFQREFRHTITVHDDPLSIETKQEIVDGKGKVDIEIMLTKDWIDPDSIEIAAEITYPDGLSELLEPEFDFDLWKLVVEDIELDKKYAINIQMIAQTGTGRPVNLRTPIIDIFMKSPEVEKPPIVEEPVIEEPAEEVETEEVSLLLIILVFVGFNLIVLTIIGVVYFFNKKEKPIPMLDEDEDEDEEGDEEEEPLEAEANNADEQAEEAIATEENLESEIEEKAADNLGESEVNASSGDEELDAELEAIAKENQDENKD